MSACWQESCPNWDGFGCPCDVLDLDRPDDPYDRPVFVQGHSHAEPICAWPDCKTYLTRDEMRDLQATEPTP